ncbi:MAG TPA: hemerythrin domain-containing protein [Brevundimonas sp.]|uniref:hemerythrin domain-containing protein n=1 Tax=Brevundimonas sp. TaxID=1871086 RepID=UPI002DE80DC2|nr:hemerythrin domain-containing protein [Brevundimonas sp.]
MPEDPLHLSTRSGLPEDLRVGLIDFPRARWSEPTVAEMARFWLGVHDGFRRHHAHLGALVSPWRDGRSDLRTLHGRLIPATQQFLQHLDMHHRIESGQYFPSFRNLDPRIAHGIDLLDRDHDVVHERLEALFAAASAFHQAILGAAPDVADHAARLSDVIDAMGPLVLRHLDDEEEIVIPLIQLRGGGLV